MMCEMQELCLLNKKGFVALALDTDRRRGKKKLKKKVGLYV